MQPPVSDETRPDGELAARVAGGDPRAAAALVRRYQAPVRSFLFRLTRRDDVADDLAQETFLRMLRHAHRYDPRYPMRTWLLTIARRLSINRGRHERRSLSTDTMAQQVSPDPLPDQLAARRDDQQHLRRQLDRAMENLTDPQRQAILLFHQQGLPVGEVARVMGLPQGTVKSHLHRARAAMRHALAPERETPP